MPAKDALQASSCTLDRKSSKPNTFLRFSRRSELESAVKSDDDCRLREDESGDESCMFNDGDSVRLDVSHEGRLFDDGLSLELESVPSLEIFLFK